MDYGVLWAFVYEGGKLAFWLLIVAAAVKILFL